MNLKILISKIINISMLIAFISLIVDIILFTSKNHASKFHIIIGWIFIGIITIHILYHIRYYKLILTRSWK